MSVYDKVEPQQLAYLEQLDIPELQVELKQAQENGDTVMIDCIEEMVREERWMDKMGKEFKAAK